MYVKNWMMISYMIYKNRKIENMRKKSFAVVFSYDLNIILAAYGKYEYNFSEE